MEDASPLSPVSLSLLELSRPDILQQTTLGSKTVHGIINLAILTDKARDDKGLEFTGNDDTGSIDLGDVDLDSSVILGSNEAASGRAISIGEISK